MSNIQSLNQNIVSEFERLVNFIQLEIDNARESKDTKQGLVNSFRQKQIKNALNLIKKFPKKITNDNLKEFSELPGIGKGTIDRIKEIVNVFSAFVFFSFFSLNYFILIF